MHNSDKALVFFGNERIATGVNTTAPTLKALIDAGYEIKAVVSNYERGTSRNARTLEIQKVAEAHNIPVLLPHNPTDVIEQLKSYKAQAAVLVAYGRIVPQSIIDIFPKGIVNIHPSLLPLHRGPTPIESVILAGEPTTGVSVMSLVRAMDAGPVYGQSEINLTGSETKQELADQLLDIGGAMVIELLPKILDDSITAVSQDETAATFDKLLTKESGAIDWNKAAATIEREIRAFTEWPKSNTTVAGKNVTITASHVIHGSGKPGTFEVQDKVLRVYCGEDILVIDRLKPAGKNEMTSEAFLAGHRNIL